MTRVLVVLAAVGILGAAAVTHGTWTDRWGPSADLQAAAARVEALPTGVGDWTGEAVPLDPRQVEVAQIAGFAIRRYGNRRLNAAATVMLLCGRPGPVAVHPPDVCYRGAGFVPGPTAKRQLPGGGELWVADFTKPGPTPETLRISWAWSDGGDWVASDLPRTEFARSKVSYKLYLIYPVPAGPATAAAPELELLTALTPDLRKCLAPTL